jgi:hypothetical protein
VQQVQIGKLHAAILGRRPARIVTRMSELPLLDDDSCTI